MRRDGRTRLAHALALTAMIGLLLGPGLVMAETDDAETEAAEPAADTEWQDASAHDPLEPVNRGIFWVNDTLDTWVLAPVARGWDWLFPAPVQQSISNFARNLRTPVDLANNLLQGKGAATSDTMGRFVINSTIGVVGFFDPAGHCGIGAHPEDFGQTLGRWGAGAGPYLMLPLLGPSNVRDGAGMIADFGFSILPWTVPGFWLTAVGVVNTVNSRAGVLEEVEDAKEASLDYYVFVRNAYSQRRSALIADIELDESSGVPDDLYDTLWDDE